ncbi:MAG: hypothetical protein ABR907_09030 [Terracidiphilus sp.]
MGILVHGEARPQLAFTANEGAGHFLTLPRDRVGLLGRSHNEGADGDAGALGALFQPLVQRFRELDGGSGWHEIIMPQTSI